MRRKNQELNRADELLEDCQSPEEILGESGLLKQLTKRLVERALAGELNHHPPPQPERCSRSCVAAEQSPCPLVQDRPVRAGRVGARHSPRAPRHV